MTDADLLVSMTDADHDWPALPRAADLRLASKRDGGHRVDADLSFGIHEPGDLVHLVAVLRDQLVPTADLTNPGPWRFDARLGAIIQINVSD
jgi:hypothetical protein